MPGTVIFKYNPKIALNGTTLYYMMAIT